MCGICLILASDEFTISSLCGSDAPCHLEDTKTNALARRGPDLHSSHTERLTPSCIARFLGHTLFLRGELTAQPCVESYTVHDPCSESPADDRVLGAGGVLLWNGELYAMGSKTPSATDNDTKLVHSLLNSCQSETEILKTVSSLEGPWAFVYLQKSTNTLWFGRDVLGRRSLLMHLPPAQSNSVFCLCSVRIANMEFTELPSYGLYCVKRIHLVSLAAPWKINLHPWDHFSKAELEGSLQAMCDGNKSNVSFTLSDKGLSSCFSHFTLSECAEKGGPLEPNTNTSTSTMTGSTYHCSVTANASTGELHRNGGLTQQESADHCGEPDVSADERAPGVTLDRPIILKSNGDPGFTSSAIPRHFTSINDSKTPKMHHTLVADHARSVTTCKAAIKTDISTVPAAIAGQVDKFMRLLSASVRIRCSTLPSLCDSCIKVGRASTDNETCGHSRIGILFSGGIDCTVLAALANEHLPRGEPIDLLNVAFGSQPIGACEERTPFPGEITERTVKIKKESSAKEVSAAPDRLTGLSSLEELRRLYPERQWNFVKVDVTGGELETQRRESIRQLIYPLNTVLDDSIGCAIWFAARGIGLLDGTAYTSTARVLLVGMGADEQLGGYSRHRSAFEQGNWASLSREIRKDVCRLSSRNMGRDDRVISDHGREARFPYLDENLVKFLNSLPVEAKMDLSQPRGHGDKLLLREAARRCLGLEGAARQLKRAVQFGSMIAKCENRREKAGDVCDRLS